MIQKVFNVNNPFWQSMGSIFDLFILNTLWLVCCIPIFTIGPATTAVFYALIQKARGEDGYPSHDFIKSFKLNFKQGVLLGFPLTLLGVFLAFDVYACYKARTRIFPFFMAFFAVLFLLWAFITLYVFPILSKFERKNSEILAWAFTSSIKNLPMTLLMLVFIVVCLWLCHILPGLIFIMFGVAAQFCATIMASIFKPFLPSLQHIPDEDCAGRPHMPDNTYADFDEAAFYGDPAPDEDHNDEG